jgi:hypothetical protein
MAPDDYPVFDPGSGERTGTLRLFRVPEIAALLHVSEKYVRQRTIHGGQWPHYLIGGMVRMSAEQINDVLRQAERGPDVIPAGDPLPLGLAVPDDSPDDGVEAQTDDRADN